ncbi:hypothetical protein GCK32_004395 [Trichostrongylus colubriformis]|uniref:Tetraspanin n=1 Tax=Trichostrongylus colubriformis TaxID=6319 RepID=A0AAN8IM13_TRICO
MKCSSFNRINFSREVSMAEIRSAGDDATEERQKNWLRHLLAKRVDESITPEVQIVVIRALINECQRLGVDRILKRSRKPLRRWKFVAWAVALLRLFCSIMILIKLMRFRFDFGTVITIPTDSLLLKMIHQAISLCLFLVGIFIVMEVILIIVFEIQRSAPIAFSYALNFVMIIFIISMAPFLVAFRANGFRLTSDLYAYAISRSDFLWQDIRIMHYHFECCGFTDRRDWQSPLLLNITTLFTNENIIERNSFGWTRECALQTSGLACYVPRFCCERTGCEQSTMNGYTTTLYLVKIAVDRSPEQAALYFDKVLNLAKIPDGTYKQPCFVAIAENLSDLAWSICRYLVALTILTLIMTLLVIVILLYNSGQGQLLPQLNRVRSPHCHPLVWAFIRMDKKEKFDYELSDYSLLEDLKNFNIDRDATERE